MSRMIRKPTHYVLAFLGIFVALYALYSAAESALPAYYAALAHSVCWVFGWFDPSVSCKENYLLYEGTKALVVVEGCDGVTFIVLILAAVLPFPASWRDKLFGLALLIPAVLAINWLRLVILAAVKFYTPRGFDFVHVYLFQPAMIAFTLIIFFLWIVSPNDRVDKT